MHGGVDQSVPPDCGGVLFGGTLKIKPFQRTPGYRPDHVYVVVWCLGDLGHDFVGRSVRMRVAKAYDSDKPCDCELIQNKIESRGIPFIVQDYLPAAWIMYPASSNQ